MNILLADGRMLVAYNGEREGVLFDDIAYITPDHPTYTRELRFAKPIMSLPRARRESLLRNLREIPPLPGA